MSYQSPLNIVKGLTANEAIELNDAGLIRLRKKLLAELNLSGETTIEVNKKFYSKDEIIKSIDALLNNPDLEIHEFIYNNPILLNYLEDESVVFNANYYHSLQIPQNLNNQFTLLIYERIIVQFKKAVSTRKFNNAEAAVIIMETFPEDVKGMCYEEVHKSLSTLNNYLNEIEHSATLSIKTDIAFISYSSFALFLNKLPEDFEYIRHELANRLINIVVAYHKLNNHDKEFALSVSSVLLKIDADVEQKKLIQSNHKVFSQNANSGSSFDFSNLRFIGFGIFLIINLLRFCNNSSSNNNHYDFKSNSDYFKNLSSTTLMPEKNTVSGTLDSYRDELQNTTTALVKQTNTFKLLFDTANPVTGYSPYKNRKFYTTTQDFNDWDKTIDIKNKLDYDVIVFEFDSVKSKLITLFIAKGDSSVVKFANKNYFMFYFGNTLVQRNNFTRAEQLNYSEFFTTNHHNTFSFLNSEYQLVLKQPKKNKVAYTLNLDNDFIGSVKNKYSFKKFNLQKAEDLLASGTVDELPEYPGGSSEMYKYLQENIRYPDMAVESNLTGKCFLKFVINADGAIENVEVIRGVPGCRECDAEAIRVIKAMPRWKPGKQNGKAVSVFFNLPVNFALN